MSATLSKRWGDVTPGELVLGDDGGIVEYIRPDGLAMLADERTRETRLSVRDLDEPTEIASPF